MKRASSLLAWWNDKANNVTEKDRKCKSCTLSEMNDSPKYWTEQTENVGQTNTKMEENRLYCWIWDYPWWLDPKKILSHLEIITNKLTFTIIKTHKMNEKIKNDGKNRIGMTTEFFYSYPDNMQLF